MSDNGLQVSTTTESSQTAQAVANDDLAGSRVSASKPDSISLDGSSTVSFEHPDSERQLLLQRLAEEERDADKLINPEDDAQTIISNDGREEESEEPAAHSEPEPLIASDHEHWQRMQEAVGFYGPGRVTEILETYMQAGVDLLPGLSKKVADLPNSAHVVLSLLREPQVVAYLNEVAETRPAQAEHDLEKISAWLAGEEEQKAVKPGPPAPIRPLGGSSTKSSVPIDEADYQTFRREREKQLKSKYRR